MKTLKEILADDTSVDLTLIADYIDHYLNDNWQVQLAKTEQENVKNYQQRGEMAYGAFIIKLLQPIFSEIKAAGLLLESNYLASSVEFWGPPEVRERCMWFILKEKDSKPLGSIVLRILHDHTKFCLPYAPRAFACQQIDSQSIKNTLSIASKRKKSVNEFTKTLKKPENNGSVSWEYSAEIGLGDYFNTDGNADMSEAFLDQQLALWGHYRWELVTVVPYQERLVAFFKRPISSNSSSKKESTNA